MIELDGTENKSRLGGNAMLAVSVASAKARAAALGVPLFQSFWKIPSPKMPGILATVISGGKFSPSSLEFEDYILSIEGLEPFSRAVEALSAIRFALERKLRADFGDFPLDGGALAPPLRSTDEAFAYMLNAARQCGFSEYVTLGLDVAASGIYDEKRGLYELGRGALDADGLIGVYKKLSADYPLTYLEDGFEENDFASFSKLAAALPGNVQIVGDDLFATNKKRLQKGLDLGCANGLLLKINQAGTVSEALETGALARELGCDIIVSLRSGETADDFIADLAVGLGARQMKLGSPVVMERNVKYNRLMRIESALLGTDGKGAL